MHKVTLVAIVGGILGFNSIAMAEGEPAGPADGLVFKAGSWDVNVIAGAYLGVGNDDETLAFGGFDLEYFVIDRLALFGEVLGYHIEQDGPDAAGGGLNLGARWYFWQPVESLALYLEGGLGLIQADQRVPMPDGTHFNFVELVGIGAKLRVTDHVAIMAGFRYQHLSNASIRGSDRNPSIDAVGGYGGLTIAF